MADDYEQLTVTQLKDLSATKAGLSLKSGLRKADIVDKLREWDQTQPGQLSAPDCSHEDASEQDVRRSETPGTSSTAKHEDKPAGPLSQASDTSTTTNRREVVDSCKERPPLPGMNDHGRDAPPVQAGGSTTSPAQMPAAAIDVAPQQVSALSEPENLPTPPPRHEPILPVQCTNSRQVSDSPSMGSVASALLPSPIKAAQSAGTTSARAGQRTSTDRTPSPAELIEDGRKRKRRSLTPPVDAREVEAKRTRIAEIADDEMNTQSTQVKTPDHVVESGAPSREQGQDAAPAARNMQHLLIKGNAARSKSASTSSDDEDVTSTSQAQHVATSGLYIANLKRPIQPKALRTRLESLAAKGPLVVGDGEQVDTLHLDFLRTHALVRMTSIHAAENVRLRLHDKVFPKEKGREPLQVDFIPSERVAEWVQAEESFGKTSLTRFHITYLPSGEAVHSEVGSIVPTTSRTGSRLQDSTSGASRSFLVPAKPEPQSPRPLQATAQGKTFQVRVQERDQGRTQQTFANQDPNARVTATTPRIRYKPVSADRISTRKAEYRDWTARDWIDETRREPLYRFSYDSSDRLVNNGEHVTGPAVHRREAGFRQRW